MPKRRERIAIYPHENGDTTVYATQKIYEALQDVDIYWFLEDAVGKQVAHTEVYVERWSALPARGKKAVKEVTE